MSHNTIRLSYSNYCDYADHEWNQLCRNEAETVCNAAISIARIMLYSMVYNIAYSKIEHRVRSLWCHRPFATHSRARLGKAAFTKHVKPERDRRNKSMDCSRWGERGSTARCENPYGFQSYHPLLTRLARMTLSH